ncbi:MAG: transglutaminase-like domain-containing protein [Clostridia bacterium]|nr:transglutaminase-like domain-containing protein [Clostridia bacterium]
MMKMNGRMRAARIAIAAGLALLFAGSAMTVAATASGTAVSGAALYLAAAAAAALCALGAVSNGGAVLASLGFVLLAGIYFAGNTAGFAAFKALFASWGGETGEPAQIALGARTLLTCGAFASGTLFFALLNRKELVSMAILLLMTALVGSHAVSETASIAAAVPGLVAAAAAFALTGGVQRDGAAPRVLVPAVLAVVLALALTPAARVTWGPMEAAAERVRGVFEQYFRFTRERIAFSINEEGYDHAGQVGDAVVSMLGGPADPHTDPVMSVDTEVPVLLRGAIRTGYTGYSWVDAAPKSRYLYVDLTHRSIRERVFSPGFEDREGALEAAEISVEMLDEGTSTLFVPGMLSRFDMALSTAVYYNTAGEVFLSRQVQPGDRYGVTGLLPVHGDALRRAVARGEAGGDEHYADLLALHTQLPEGIEAGVYALTMEVVDGLDNPYDRAAAIMEYLRRSMRYTLDTPYPPEGRDFVSWFLLDSREGYCSYYATAMAVMGRIAGLPTRYVEGYLARPGREALTGEDAHAWAEVYFKGVGWIPFDATGGATGRGGTEQQGGDGQSLGGDAGSQEMPSGDFAGDEPETTPTPEPAGGEAENEPTPSPEPEEQPDEAPEESPEAPDIPPEPESEPEALPEGGQPTKKGPSVWAAILLVLALIALAALWVRRRLRSSDPAALCARTRSARQQAMILYRANLTLLGHMGQAPVNGEGPETFAERVAGQLKNPDYAAFVRAVSAFAYGRRPITRDDVEAGQRAYAAFRQGMRFREKLRFGLTRLLRGLGSFEQIP